MIKQGRVKKVSGFLVRFGPAGLPAALVKIQKKGGVA